MLNIALDPNAGVGNRTCYGHPSGAAQYRNLARVHASRTLAPAPPVGEQDQENRLEYFQLTFHTFDSEDARGGHLQIDGLAKYATLTVAPFDTQVLTESMYVHEKGKKCEKTRVACGGTSFQCVTDYANEHKEFDALIILTDLGAPTPGPCRVRRIWLADQENATNPCFDPASLNERLLVVK